MSKSYILYNLNELSQTLSFFHDGTINIKVSRKEVTQLRKLLNNINSQYDRASMQWSPVEGNSLSKISISLFYHNDEVTVCEICAAGMTAKFDLHGSSQEIAAELKNQTINHLYHDIIQ